MVTMREPTGSLENIGKPVFKEYILHPAKLRFNFRSNKVFTYIPDQHQQPSRSIHVETSI